MPRTVTMAGAGQTLGVDGLYRLYSLSDAGAITAAEKRQFPGDAQALVYAQGLLAAHPAVEVWQTHRFVGRLGRPGRIHDQAAMGAADAAPPMTDHEAVTRLRRVIEDWRSGSLPAHSAMAAVGEVLGLAAEVVPMAHEGAGSRGEPAGEAG